MIVYRVLDEPRVNTVDGNLVWGVMCLLDEGKDVVLFDDEETAWQFYHDVNMRFEPMEIGDES